MNERQKIEGEAREDSILDFEKSRFEYCSQLFDKEEKTKESIERKCQFYLSFATIFLGTIFLKLDYLKSVKEIYGKAKPPTPVSFLVYTIVSVLLISVIIALTSVLKSMGIRNYAGGFHRELDKFLFESDERPETSSELHIICARFYAQAVDKNRKLNAGKAKWLVLCSYSLLIAVMSMFALIITIGVLAIGQ